MTTDRSQIRRAWYRLVFVLVVGVSLSVMIAGYAARDNDVAGCVRNSEFKVIEARAWEEAAKARSEDGDRETATVYRSTAQQIRSTIPVRPRDRSVPRGEIADNRRRGCEASFPPPIPFIE